MSARGAKDLDVEVPNIVVENVWAEGDKKTADDAHKFQWSREPGGWVLLKEAEEKLCLLETSCRFGREVLVLLIHKTWFGSEVDVIVWSLVLLGVLTMFDRRLRVSQQRCS